MQIEEVRESYPSMKLVTREDYLEFLKVNKSVIIGKNIIKLGSNDIIRDDLENYRYESSSVWSFPERGYWYTHRGDYRGNWSPYIPRNLIIRYTKPRDLVLDQMVGSGTTLVECKLLNRNAIGVDINYNAIILAQDRLNFDYKSESVIDTYHGDARNLDKINDNSIDLIATHPPYGNIISYSEKSNKLDLSSLSINDYLTQMYKVAKECFRVLKDGKYCTILIGDTRKHKHYISITHNILHIFLESGFILKDYIIKIQHNTKATRERWLGSYDFYKIAHEHLLIFRKPGKDEKISHFRYSTNLL